MWPLDENYCRTILLLHTANWWHLQDIKNDDVTRVDQMIKFLDTDQCPNFVKAEIEKAKNHCNDSIPQEEKSEPANESL